MSAASLPVRLAALGWALMAGLAAALFARQVWLGWPAAGDELAGIVLAYSTLPRASIALLAGAALGLSGALLQRTLRNPIADPSTLGVAAGAQLAMTAATIYAPLLMETAREPIAFAGGMAALLIILSLSWRRGLDPVTVILSGMLISLVAASLSATIVLANGEYMMSLFIWGGGSLEQQGWAPSLSLLLRLGLAGALAAALIRPLQLLGLEDSSARALGLGITGVRLLVLTLAVALATSVTAEVGVIGFIGLAAPNLARLGGARTLSQLLIASVLIGALILWLTDGLVQAFSLGDSEIVPTGAATALLGGPMLLWLLPRLRPSLRPAAALAAARRRLPARPVLLGLGAVVLVLAALALGLGRGGQGWFLATGAMFETVAPWRWPRIVSGAAAGAMLATAGFVMQRVTGNAMASPEVLGVSSGAGVGLAAVLILWPGASRSLELAGALGGSLAALVLVLAIAARNRFGADKLLLAGIAVGSLSGAAVTTVVARGGPEAMQLLNWVSGSTQRLAPSDALSAGVLAILIIAPVPFLSRWLGLLPLGPSVSRALGLGPEMAGGVLVLLAALLSAASTLIVGPLSFVGLMAPHLARLAGIARPVPQLGAAILIGMALMIFSDWMARTLAFPYQLPLGLFAALIGGPYLVFLLNRKAR
ncbi:Fe(3+)-hydroxamate ABC transporter permease FhuB [Aureimonas populi]|uniref:Fe(3+)-hydroxamate ABC transporter permease FhuB n=1 Tax=Aureimonas populi TaxID=1701758 RepID=A0ABW5CM31_9HYPH|nr:Fe(3+)-hydroxamate ABC transporter permease FhuB [Aureimonas populi]